jgi:ABC-type polysaccharide/polyol phosphate export permease
VTLFIAGMLVMGYVVAGLFFFRFWKQTRDRLFALFAAAFALLAGQRVVLAIAVYHQMDTTSAYVLRLLAFLLFLGAIVDKNRGAGKG